MSRRRIGVLGGTFDPPHVGHLWLATLAADSLGLERVLFMPAAEPPHKRGTPTSAAADRLEMTRRAIEGNDGFALSMIEMERAGPSYTIDSAEELRRIHPDTDFVLVMASDSLAEIDEWREPGRLLATVEWAVGPRPGTELVDRAALVRRFGADADRIHVLDGPGLAVSSSEIRRRVAAGHAIRYLVPRGVEMLIAERGLYRSAARTS